MVQNGELMEKSKKLNLIGLVLLLLATLVWGTSFFILKETISQVPTFFVLAIRFVVAGLALLLIFIKKIKKISAKNIICGAILGVFLTLAYVFQTLGLERTTPGRNAFLTSSYCVVCPFILWVLFKQKPKFYNAVSAIICIVGVGMVALSNGAQGGAELLVGDALTLVGAVFFSFQIIFIDRFQKEGHESVGLLVFELLTTGVIFALLTLIFELPTSGIGAYAINFDQILRIGYLTLFCTLFAQFAQMTGQKFTSPNQCSLVLSLEAVFGVLFSVIFTGEVLTPLIVCGFVAIFIAMLISELRFEPSKILKNKQEKKNDINK